MRFFPQLSSGALAQYPLKKRVIRRTITNTLPDGSAVKLADSGIAAIEWDLQFNGLSDQETSALEQLFIECEGDLRTFAFLDPTANLLAWSEDFMQDAWVKDPLLLMEHGVPDPLGGTSGFRLANSTAVSRSMRQTLDTPAGYRYCFSAWCRCQQGNSVIMRTGSETRQFPAGAEWARISMTANLQGDGESVVFGLEVQPAQTLDVFGFQAEAQPGASGYRRTGSTGGVYPAARFGTPHLRITAEGFNAHACRVTVISNANGL